MLTLHKTSQEDHHGFTIVELLIVIVVIAILAAISIVAYTGIQNRAYNTTIQSDLKNIATKIEMYHAREGVYPATTGSNGLPGLELTASKSAYHTDQGIHMAPHPPIYNLLYCRSTDSTRFALIARSKSGDTFRYAGGSVGAYQGVIPAGATVLCNGAGITGTDGSSRVWLYDAGSWQTWVR